eukprot:7242949-Alexandrium_andersonii.AAC.1
MLLASSHGRCGAACHSIHRGTPSITGAMTAQCATTFTVARRLSPASAPQHPPSRTLHHWALRRSVPQHSPRRTVFMFLFL